MMNIAEIVSIINVAINGLRLLLEWIKDHHHSEENNRPRRPGSQMSG